MTSDIDTANIDQSPEDTQETEDTQTNRAPVRADSPTFADLGARPETVEALTAAGITRAFAIQEYAIPIAMRGTDLIGQAPTGTGKTLGFGVPLLECVTSAADGADGAPQALVVVPTRELGLQVARDIDTAGRTRGIRVLPVYGGVAYEPQVEALKQGVEIIVGTPGRLLDLAKPAKGKSKAYLRLDQIRALVLDEADRMLDLGFLDDVEKILAMLPSERQTMLFSATMPDPIVTLARRFLRQPVTIHAKHDAATTASPLTKQVVYRTHPLNKVEVVSRILQAEARGLTMIFTRTKRAADRCAEDLDFRGFAVAAVHGDLGQSARERALRAFRNGKIDVLVATDVAARGLDVSGVTHVINYDCPEDPDTYTHRIGRTGRAGASGVAVTFVDWEDMPRWRIIDKSLGLDMPDPPETYHTSPHLLTDLAIPEGSTGKLARADRTRAGLGAEVEEDLGGTRRRGRDDRGGHRGSDRGDRRDRGGDRGDRGGDRGDRGGDRGDRGGESVGPRSEPRKRTRRKVTGTATETAAEVATATATAEPAIAPVTDGEAGTERGTRSRRRRRGGAPSALFSDATSTDGEAAAAPAAAGAPAIAAGAVGTAGAVDARPVDAGPVDAGPVDAGLAEGARAAEGSDKAAAPRRRRRPARRPAADSE